MEVYRLTDKTMERVSEHELEDEATLENHLVKTSGAEIGGVELMYIEQQGRPDAGGKFDILGLDQEGNAVILELKRGRSPRKVIAQALEYAAGIRNETYGDLALRYQKFLRDRGESEGGAHGGELVDAHASYFELGDTLAEREFNTDQRIVVVGTSFGDKALNMADFLREHEIDFVCVEYSAYAAEDGALELLTTDAIRRPLRLEPSGSSEQSYPELLLAIRDIVYPSLKDTLALESPEDIARGRPNKEIKIHPQSPVGMPVHYTVRPFLNERGTIDVRTDIHGASEEVGNRLQAVVRKYDDEMDDFETHPDDRIGVVFQELTFDDDELVPGHVDSEVVERVANELIRMIDFYHPKFASEFSGEI